MERPMGSGQEASSPRITAPSRGARDARPALLFFWFEGGCMTAPAPTQKTYLAFGAVAVTIVAWASAFPLIRIALAGLRPLSLAAARFWLAGSIAAVWLAATRPAR